MTSGSATKLGDAVTYLDRRARLAYDRLGGGRGRSGLNWTLQDAHAIRTILAELRPRCVLCGAPTLGGDSYCWAHTDLNGAA